MKDSTSIGTHAEFNLNQDKLEQGLSAMSAGIHAVTHSEKAKRNMIEEPATPYTAKPSTTFKWDASEDFMQ